MATARSSFWTVLTGSIGPPDGEYAAGGGNEDVGGTAPIELHLSVTGEPQSGPTYKNGNKADTFGGNTTQSPAARPASEESGFPVWWVLGPLAAVVILGGGTVTGLLIYRRR